MWFLESAVTRLSNDRILRVMQTASFVDRQNLKVKKIEKRKIKLGDWCAFKKEEGTQVLVGRVLSISLLEDASKFF